MTRKNRPMVVSLPPPSSSSAQDLRISPRRGSNLSLKSAHSRTSSIDSYLSKESLVRVSGESAS